MKKDNNFKNFNIVISGTGGQGLITILEIFANAALAEGYDVKTSELHGLSQRGGSVDVHIRFGEKIYSPLIPQGKADLILSLEMQEAIRQIYFANPLTNFLINKNIIPIPQEKTLTEQEILAPLLKATKNVIVVPAKEICKEKLGLEVFSCVFLLGFAVFKKLIPLKTEAVLKAIKTSVPKKHLESNIKAFNLAKEY